MDAEPASAGGDSGGGADDSVGLDAFSGGGGEQAAAQATADEGLPEGEPVEFTGVVVQAGDPVVLDDGERTVSVDTDADVELGQELTVSGPHREGRIDADEVR